MDAGIKKMIDARREDLDKYYDLPPRERAIAETMLGRLERLGRRCRNEAEFRKKFSTLTMYQDYNCMLLEFSAYIKPELSTKK